MYHVHVAFLFIKSEYNAVNKEDDFLLFLEGTELPDKMNVLFLLEEKIMPVLMSNFPRY